MSHTLQPLSDLDQFTAQELRTLNLHVGRAVTRLYDSATAIHTEMSATPATWTAKYQDLKAKAAVIMAAAGEQHQLYRELADAIDYRSQI